MKIDRMLCVLIGIIAMMQVYAEDKAFKCCEGQGSSLKAHKILRSLECPPWKEEGGPACFKMEWYDYNEGREMAHKGCVKRAVCEDIRVNGHSLNGSCDLGIPTPSKIALTVNGEPFKVPSEKIALCCCNTNNCNSGQPEWKASLALAALMPFLIQICVHMY